MGKRSLFYAGPRIYKVGLRLIHGKQLDQRYEYIAKQIGKNKSVLEPACGPALIPNYLDASNSYSGFDINEKFVQYARDKGLDVQQGNAKDASFYKSSDIVVLCDALHHIVPEMSVLEHSLNSAQQKLIICDPFKDQYLKMLPGWLPGSFRLLSAWYDYVEKDGNNQVRLEKIRMKKELQEVMMAGFGVIPNTAKRNIQEIGEDLIVTYHL
jgi:hypothetical protein